MNKVTKYPHGCFNWVDLTSTDAEAAKTFYCSLFGWTFLDMPLPHGGVYTMLQLDGLDVAALSQMDEGQMSTGMPSAWNSYINVDDLEAATVQAEAAGATIIVPLMDVMDSGRMTVIQDPTGAYVSLWEAGTHIGASICNLANTHTWNELTTPDPEKAAEFYTTALGWEAQAAGEGYWMFTNRGRNGSGMIKLTEEMGPVPPHWRVYFGVPNIAAAAAQVTELGGNIIMGPFDAGNAGQIAIAADPTGAVFNIIEAQQYDSMP